MHSNIKADDNYLTDRVHTEENSYCVADCHVLNEEKLVGCPTAVPGLIRYCLEALFTNTLFPIFLIQYTTRHVRTKESDSYVHFVNGLSQKVEWYVRKLLGD